MRNLLFAAIMGSSAMMGVAVAQETNTTATDAPQQADTGAQTEGGFITWQGQDQMIASNLMSAPVWGANNEAIGTVDDLLLDRDGQIIGVVVGIGGFLGIGQRDVAISTDQLEFVLAQDVQAAGGVPGAGVPADAAAQDPALAPQSNGAAADGTIAPAPTGGTAAGQAGTAGTSEEARTASDATGAAAGAVGTAVTGVGNGATAGMGWTGQVLDHIQVNYTREQLEEAPPFERAQ